MPALHLPGCRVYAMLGLALALVCTSVELRAEPTVSISEDFVLRAWEVDDGLPANQVRAMAQTPDGYLWLATEGGLTRFDGWKFTSFAELPGLETNRVHSLCVRRSGELWLGLEGGGAALMRDGRFEMVVPTAVTSDSAKGYVTSLAEDARGAMWMGFAGETRVARWDEGKLTNFGAKDGVGPRDEPLVHADNAGRIWFATKGGCGVFDGERFQPVDPIDERVRLAPSANGGMWAAKGMRLLRLSAGGGAGLIADLAWLGGSIEVRVLFEDDEGTLWIGTRGAGLYRFRNGQFLRVPTSHDSLLALAQTRDGNLWAGTRGGGLNRVAPRQFFLRTARHGLGKDWISSIVMDSEQSLWVLPRESRPVRAVTPRNDLFAAVPGWHSEKPISTAYADERGNVWLGSDGGGVFRWSDGLYQSLETAPRVEAIHLARDGSLWVAPPANSLTRWKDGIIQEEIGCSEFRSVCALGEDEGGGIWVGTREGTVLRRDGAGPFSKVTLPDVKSGQSIRFFLPDGPETMWIGTGGGGLLRCRKEAIARVTMTSGLPDDDVRQLAFDRLDQAWIGTGRHLCRIARAELEAVLDGRQRMCQPIVFGRDDGLPALGFTPGGQHATVRTPDDHLWMATDRGALEIAPAPRRQALPLPPVIVEEMRVSGIALPLGGGPGLRLPSRARQLELRYTVPRFTAAERLQFRYRLVGFDPDWIDAGEQRRAIFTRLPPGEYHFEVTAREPSGKWTTPVAMQPFTIQPAWWETLWFRLCVIGAGAIALTWLVHFISLRRIRARVRRLEEQTALARERSRIARDLHDQVGANLTQISLLAEFATTPDGMAQLTETTREAAEALDSVVWAVDPRKDTLQSLLQYLVRASVDFLRHAGIHCRIEIPAEVPARELSPEFRHHVLLIVKEALNNVAKYARASEVELGASLGSKSLSVTVADNGESFDSAEVAGEGNGLRNMRERAAALGGECHIESRRGSGTKITVTTPWPSRLPKSK